MQITGALTFDTATDCLSRGQEWLKNQTTQDCYFDLREVTQSDSAGVAVLVEWVRFAKQQNRILRFKNLPPQLFTIIQVSGLDTVLPITHE
jgi:phospholipid transport system transporter-binding protein